MKDIRSLLLALLSVGLVATWVYHLYDKSHYNRVMPASLVSPDSTTSNTELRDSLQKVYSANLDVKLDSSQKGYDSLQTALAGKVNEVARLKSEINDILKKPASSNAELALARQKMAEMEEIIRQLREQNTALEQEKKQLTNRLDQMGSEVDNLQRSIRKLDDDNKGLNDKIKTASVFVASAVHFTTLHNHNDNEQETTLARKANKFVASFMVQNNFNEYPNAEVMIVISEPDGRVLQNSNWDSGTFDSKNEGRKSYTRRMKFDYARGEQKTLIFTLEFDSFQKGTYTLQIWHNGMKIGETTKTLS